MEQDKKIIFEYSVNSAMVTPYTVNTKYAVYDDGYIEKQILDRNGEFITKRIKYGKSEQAVAVIQEFYNSHKDIIDSIPSELDNSEVCDGSYIFVKFLDKSISGFNIIYSVSPEAKEYDDINKFQKLMDEFINTLKHYSCFNKLVKVILERFQC